MVRLRDGLSMLWRAEGEAQIGLDPRCGVVLENLTDVDQQLLAVLAPDPSVGDPSVRDLVRLGRAHGVSAARTRELVRTLERAGVLAPGAVPRPPAQDGPRLPATARAGDVAYWGRLRADGDGWATLARRREATAAVLGMDRLGMLLASGLAAAGVGRVLCADAAPVEPRDVAPGGFTVAEVGHPREEAAARLLPALVPDVRTSARGDTRPDVAVLVEQGVASPVRSRPLVREDIPHLSVVVGEVDVLVGPFVLPGQGPCLRCLDLHRCDADPRWPVVATQVAAAPPAGVESALAALAASLAVAQVLAHLDTRTPASLGATLEVSACDPVPLRRAWSVHRECGCAGPRRWEPATGPPAGRP